LNAFLLSLGIALVLALCAALAAPFFIDWSSQRHFFEARAAEILGQPVEFVGPLEARLVPFPRLMAQNVRIGAQDTGQDGAERLIIRAALLPLLSGELEVTEVVLTRPRVTVKLDDNGGVAWAAGSNGSALPVSPERTRLERLEIVEGTLVVENAPGDAPLEMTGLNLTGSAGTLAGPFRVEGGGFVDGRRYTLRIGTGRLQQNGDVRFTASVVPADRPLTVDLDGTHELRADGGPRFRGAAVVAQPALGDRLVPWRVEADVAATARAVVFNSLAVGIGTETERFALDGTGTLELGAEPRFDVALAARQLDFDRAYGGGVDEPALPATALARTFRENKAKGLWAGMAAHGIQPLDNWATSAIALVLLASGHAGGWPVARGGSRALADALAAYFKALGGEIYTGWMVKTIDELPAAKAVLFDVGPRQLMDIAGKRFSPLYRWQLNRYRYGMGVFKADFALDGPIPWQAPEPKKAGTVHLGGSLENIAHAESVIWKGSYTDNPYMLVAQQSVFDNTRAPEGMHTVWAYCHVPAGSTRDLMPVMENQIEKYAPGFKKRIVGKHAFNTLDMEAYNPNYIGGDINAGVQDLTQIFTRPALRLSPYRTSAKGIYICSSSTPPGGGVHGMCGYHAAQRVLKDLF
jgi:phytoene dehydrogenase-like protein